MDGVPTTVLDDFPAIKAHHNRVAEVEAVKAFYAKWVVGHGACLPHCLPLPLPPQFLLPSLPVS